MKNGRFEKSLVDPNPSPGLPPERPEFSAEQYTVHIRVAANVGQAGMLAGGLKVTMRAGAAEGAAKSVGKARLYIFWVFSTTPERMCIVLYTHTHTP